MQQNVIDLWSAICSDTCEFLLSEPICYFVSIVLLIAVAKLFSNIIYLNGGKF